MKRIPIRVLAALVAVTVAAIVAVALLLPAAAPPAPHAPQSIFQDDDHLLYANTANVARTLDALKALGVRRVRLTIEWAYIAPNATSRIAPTGFDAANPAAYPSGAWARYDRVVQMAQARGLGVDFNVTAPGPLWAMQPAPVTTATGGNPGSYEPSASAFGQFVQALGTRYSGAYLPKPPRKPTSILLPSLASKPGKAAARPLPRVNFWSIWNEPNQPAWLAPQWQTVAGQPVPSSPRLYRVLLDAAVAALEATGHTPAGDTILVGETAPEGRITAVKVGGHQRYVSTTGIYKAMTPMVFVRALYCVDSSYRQLTGTAASVLGCPSRGNARAFVTENPGLFSATGFAHHPYYFNFAPSYSSPVADFVPLADLGRLEGGLDRIYATYAVNRKIPIYLTEYGYQTNPPDPYQVVSAVQQASYLNEADYLAWRDARVRSVAQFLLYDAGPDARYPPSSFNYWDTFQTGLRYGPGTALDGRAKPAYTAYRLPIWIPERKGSEMLIWGMLRLAPPDTAQRAQIQWRPAHRRGRYRTIATVRVPASARYGYFTTRVTPPGSGGIRIAWRSPTGKTFTSRTVGTVASLPPPSAGRSAFATIQSAFDSSPNQVIAPCQFSSAQLAAAQSSIPNDNQQYDQNLVAAIEQARQERADGACSANRRIAGTTGTTTVSTTTAITPAPPPAPSPGRNTPLRIGSATAATDSGLPAPVAILLVLGVLVALCGAVFGVVRFGGWDPTWAARLRHSWGEAGYRVAGLSSGVGAWFRR